MASERTVISDNVQDYLEKKDWNAAIAEMERLFALVQDPLIRVRIGDARRKLNRNGEAIQEYVLAADLFAEKGFVVKALAQYSLVLRLDSSNTKARSQREVLRSIHPCKTLKREPVEYRIPEELGNVRPAPSMRPLLWQEDARSAHGLSEE